jgi:hypothetical protein
MVNRQRIATNPIYIAGLSLILLIRLDQMRGVLSEIMIGGESMPNTTPKIENLMKVSLNIVTGNPTVDDASGTPFEFIYGIGPSGITPFEKALFGKTVGNRIQFDLASTDFCEMVGHLALPIRKQTGMIAPVSLEVTITDVNRAQDREVVKAMAAGGSCSDCGCGCGGH